MNAQAWSPAGSDDQYNYATAVVSVFWPESHYHALVTRWPHLAAQVVGAPWAEHCRQVERNCAFADREGFAVNLVPGNLPDFETFLKLRGVTTPGADDLRAYPDVRDAESAMMSWPPSRTASCWCGSGHRYKQCCRPYGLGSLS